MPSIILASQSPRRKSLLEQAEITFEIKTAHSDENYPDDLDPDLVPEFIAANKAEAVLQSLNKEQHADTIIIAADTVVILGDEIIGKPTDEEHAIETLKKLSGKIHKVITGVVLKSNVHQVTFRDTTFVHFLELTEEQIRHYVEHYKPFDKAGAYAIQEWIGVVGIKKIDGDFYNVMGLPVSKVLEALKSF
jgi:septum formation protein